MKDLLSAAAIFFIFSGLETSFYTGIRVKFNNSHISHLPPTINGVPNAYYAQKNSRSIASTPEVKPYKSERMESLIRRLKLNPDEIDGDSEVIVAIIDTGYDMKDTTLNKSLLMFGSHKAAVSLIPEEDADDLVGHGTSVAQIILSLNPKAKIVPIKATSETMYQSHFGDAIKKAANIPGVRVINISMGGFSKSVYEELEIENAIKKGITVVASAGNESNDIENIKYYPASLYKDGNIITVSSVDDQGTLLPSSNFSRTMVEFAALGDATFFTYRGKAKKFTGTSQAAAVVSGLVSLVISHKPNLTSKEIKSLLISYSDNKNNLPVKYGEINYQALVKNLENKNDASIKNKFALSTQKIRKGIK